MSFARRRPTVAGLAALGVALSGLAVVSAAAPAQAAPADHLVISEVYGGGGNSGANLDADFVELYNPTASSVSLSGLTLQYRSSGGSGAANGVADLSGTVPAGSHFLVQTSTTGSNGSPLPTPDLTVSGVSMAAANGTVYLSTSATALTLPTGSVTGNAAVVDLVGFGSTNTFETAATPAISVTTSAGRTVTEEDSDDNSAEFQAGAQTPTASVAGELGAVQLADVTAYLGIPISDITLAATGGTPPYNWEVSGLPAGLSETSDGVIGGTPTEEGAFLVAATVTDSEDPAATDEVTFTITVNPAPAPIPIAEIQGTGASSELVGDTVVTEGVVTAMYPTGGFNGIYIQTGGTGSDADGTPGASDAIFVFGTNSQPAGVELGDSVEVTGVVSEFGGLTEITPIAGGVVELDTPLAPVTPQTVVPGTDCALPGTECLNGAALDEAKEAHEGELFLPTGDYTATDVYDGSAYNGGGFSSGMFGEIGLAAESDQPLVTPTEVIDAQDTVGIAARRAYNDAHRVILDDGASTNYASSSNTDEQFPWFTADHTVRVGAGVTFDQPVVLDYRFGWKLQPQSQIVGAPTGKVTFEQDRPAQPEDVGGDLKLATFNVLNYFTTLGVDYGDCTSYKDRDGNPITVNRCPGAGPRGAWDTVNFERQEAKIVDSINTLDADIVTLEEIENSLAVDGHDRDEAVSTLVDALNDDAGSTRWAYVESPAEVPTSEDVIRNAFIYNPGTVDLVGDSEILIDDPAFHNARDPFAQTFKAAEGDNADAFAVIANHFKSKGSGEDDGTGQGNANPDRIDQAEALVSFADDFAAANGVDKIYLTGDFNAYSMEDPVQVLTAAGYTGLESTDDPHEETYNFDGQIGSLDHIFANEAAAPDVTGVDIWTTNGYESVYYEYSRFNYNVTNLYDDGPFRASDHNPEIVGIEVADAQPGKATPHMSAKVKPKRIVVNRTKAKVIAVVKVDGEPAKGKIRVKAGGKKYNVKLNANGRAMVKLKPFGKTGKKKVKVIYLGNATTKRAVKTLTIRVVRR